MVYGAFRPGLRGRRRESEALDALLGAVRAGESRALLVRGEAGVGKTALLDQLAERATGFRVVRAAGVESEMELAFAGLHQLCLSLLDGLERLPAPQRDALSVALGLVAGAAPDRFLVGLAVLSLLSDAAEAQPLLCVIDDAQWQDQATASTLAFVARRLYAESVGLVFAAREPVHDLPVAGLPELVVDGLEEEDARALLDTAIRGRIDPALRDRLVAEANGNPLALLELPRGLAPAELAGGFGLPDVLPLTGRMEASFLRRVSALPAPTRLCLLVAAAEPIGDVALLLRASEKLGLGPDAAVPAQAAGLIGRGPGVRFLHPLMRSAAYRAATPEEVRAVHRALADATDPHTDPDRRAWHRAQATVGPDEAVAAELERSAGRAQARGGIAAAAAFLERATELTPDLARRGARALDAAQAKLDAAAPDAALELLASAELGPLDELQRARQERMRAQVVFARYRGRDAARLLLDAARRLERLDPAAARETYLEALVAAMFAGRLGDGPGVEEIAAAARSGPAAPPDAPRVTDLLLDGLVARFADPFADAVPILRRALDALAVGEPGAPDNTRWLWLGVRLATDLWDDVLWHVLATKGLREARAAGAIARLPLAATYRAALHVHAGRFGAAVELIEEADAITDATATAPVNYGRVTLAAWRGDTAVALPMFAAGRADTVARGEGMAVGGVEWSAALLHNGGGRYADALAAARTSVAHDDVGTTAWAHAELVEAAVRCGERDLAEASLAWLRPRTSASGTAWALGTEAGLRALLATGAEADALYRESIERLTESCGAVHLARARLRYGEWLRREGRRVDAREQLRAAHEAFAEMGADAFAERARGELLATGETVRRRGDADADALTPQEAQVARLAAQGHTNPEIGAQLFISPRTVEYHLRKVFAKLGIASRRELAGALPAGAAQRRP